MGGVCLLECKDRKCRGQREMSHYLSDELANGVIDSCRNLRKLQPVDTGLRRRLSSLQSGSSCTTYIPTLYTKLFQS